MRPLVGMAGDGQPVGGGWEHYSRRVIRLLTPPADGVIEDLTGFCLDAHRPGVRCLLLNMVTSVDGATAANGETAPLSDPDDRALFHALRAACDVVLVGAETVRAEGYGPVRIPDPVRRERTGRGLGEVPRLAVVSRGLDLEPFLPRLVGDSGPPYVFTGEDSPQPRRSALSQHAEVLVAGRSGADPVRLVNTLWRRGHQVILCEGGPTLAGQLAAQDLIDEVNLTISAQLVGGTSPRLLDGIGIISHRFRLDRVMTGDRMLFARYLRDRP